MPGEPLIRLFYLSDSKFSMLRPYTVLRNFRLISPITAIATVVTTASTAANMPTRISDVVKHDHAELKDFYGKIINATDDDSKVRWQNQFTWELARHSVGEELVVYPAMEKHMSNGKELADRDRASHQTVKEMLQKFQSLYPNDQDFEPTIRSLMAELSEHIEEEERDDLPALEDNLPEGQSEALAKSFQRTKLFVPTRSHPSAPDKPPFETVVGLMAAPIDKLNDMFRRFPQT